MEFDRPPEDVDRFNRELDDGLRVANYNYRAKRGSDVGMDRHVLTVAPRGTFARWLKLRGKQGGQHKVPRLVNHRAVIEEVLAVINVVG